MENKKLYHVSYMFNTETNTIDSVSIGDCPVAVLPTICQVAHIHIPAMIAFRKENPTIFNRVTLPIADYEIVFKIYDKLRD